MQDAQSKIYAFEFVNKGRMNDMNISVIKTFSYGIILNRIIVSYSNDE